MHTPREAEIRRVMEYLGLEYIQARNHVLGREQALTMGARHTEARRHDKRSDFGSTVPAELR